MVGRRWIDVTDLAFYLSHHSSVSGIQRVISEVLPYFVHDVAVECVLYSEAQQALVRVPRYRVVALLDMLADVRDHPDHKAALAAEARRLIDDAQYAPAVQPAQGDVLAIIGAAWIFPQYFRAVRALKSQGVGILVLVYDLIPIMMGGFPADSTTQFHRYAEWVVRLADRVPAISAWSRSDYVAYCLDLGMTPQGGGVIRLGSPSPSGRESAGAALRSRPFVLFVGTIEDRKGHRDAYEAWRIMSDRLVGDTVPDLVCVGRVGWNANDFLEAFASSNGLGGRIVLLDGEVSDETLARLYQECLFTIYPSRYEGWGLPVAESIAHGKPVITTTATSLPEPAGPLACYVPPEDPSHLAKVVMEWVTDPAALQSWIDRVREGYAPVPWSETARLLEEEMHHAVENREPGNSWPKPEVDTEYGLGRLEPFRGMPHDGVGYLRHVDESRRLSLTGEVLTVAREVVGDQMCVTDGLEIAASGRLVPDRGEITLRFRRPSIDRLHLAVITGHGGGTFRCRVNGPRGAVVTTHPRGGCVVVDLGYGPEDALIDVTLRIGALGDSLGEGVLMESVLVASPSSRLIEVPGFARHLDAILSQRGSALEDARLARANLEDLRTRLSDVEWLEGRVDDLAVELEDRQVVIEELVLAKSGAEDTLRTIYSSRMWRWSNRLRRLLGR